MSLRISRDILQTFTDDMIFYRRLWLFLFPHLCVRAAVSYFSLEILGGEIGAKSTEIDLLAHAQRMTADQRKKYNSQ